MAERVVVTVNEGKIRGIKKKSTFSGTDYYSFFGVPYGQSTAGKARFKDPVKVKPWKSVLDATTEVKNGCMQYSLREEGFAGSEDCLYNNIHTSGLPVKGDALKPVIVCLHPGALFHGTPETWYYGSPDYVMQHDIVYVCVAFRLHVLGFLNLGMDECAGNQALKDVILSLRWIKENIGAFGGDPGNVTLLGSSSGAFLVHFLLLSPAVKGLFHKAVLMGMYAFNPALATRHENMTEAFQVARNLGYDGTDPKDVKKLIAFFKKSNMEKFILFRSETKCNTGIMGLFPSSPFMPLSDYGENAVLPESPEKLINSTARIPIMFGMCDKESAMGFMRGMENAKDVFYTSYRQNVWGWGRNVKDDDVKHITEEINSFYFNGNSFEGASLSSKMDVQTDIAFSSIYETLIDIVAADLPSSVFVYKFEFEGNAFTMKNRIERVLAEPIQGSVHAADYSYWGHLTDYHGVKTVTLSPKSREMVETFTKLITTFARTGDPNYEGLEVQWKPTTPEQPCYLNINGPLKLVDGKLNGERMKFWENLKKPYEVTH